MRSAMCAPIPRQYVALSCSKQCTRRKLQRDVACWAVLVEACAMHGRWHHAFAKGKARAQRIVEPANEVAQQAQSYRPAGSEKGCAEKGSAPWRMHTQECWALAEPGKQSREAECP